MSSKTAGSATAFYEAVAQALPLVKTDSTIEPAEEDSNDFGAAEAAPLTFTTSLPEADDYPDEKANGSIEQWEI